MTEAATSGRGRWIGLALGTPIMAWGARGILQDAADTKPGELVRWLVGSAVVHDLLVLPVVLALGVGARRLVPARAWPAVRWALFTTGVLVLVSWPYVRGYGRAADNPSALPRDYGTGLAVTLALVWTSALAWAAVAHRLPRRKR